MKKIQHTKLVLDILIVAFIIIGLCSIYINYKNGLGMDMIFSSICDTLKWIIPSGCAKSYFETKEEYQMRLKYLEKGLKYDDQQSNYEI